MIVLSKLGALYGALPFGWQIVLLITLIWAAAMLLAFVACLFIVKVPRVEYPSFKTWSAAKLRAGWRRFLEGDAASAQRRRQQAGHSEKRWSQDELNDLYAIDRYAGICVTLSLPARFDEARLQRAHREMSFYLRRTINDPAERRARLRHIKELVDEVRLARGWKRPAGPVQRAAVQFLTKNSAVDRHIFRSSPE